jgi:large subunit ribosomal protein L29
MAAPSDLRAKTVSQLETDLVELRKERFNLKFQQASGRLENTARVRVVRRDIARIMTVLGEMKAKSGGA